MPHDQHCGGRQVSHGSRFSLIPASLTEKRLNSEVIERRYPVVIHEFSIREGSGGSGKWSGGCGIVRDFEVGLFRLNNGEL